MKIKYILTLILTFIVSQTNCMEKVIDIEFFEAIENANIQKIKEFINNGIDINIKNSQGNTALLDCAIKINNIYDELSIATRFEMKNAMQMLLAKLTEYCNILEILINHQAININAFDKNKNNVLMLILNSVDFSPALKRIFSFDFLKRVFITILNHKNLDINAKNEACQNILLRLSEICNDKEIFKIILSNEKLEINAQDSEGKTALMNSVTNLDHTGIVQLLLKHPNLDLNTQDKDGKTALIKVLDISDLYISYKTKSLKLLLNRDNLNPNIKDHSGKTALMHILSGWKSSKKEIIEFSKQKNLDLDIQDNDGKTALDLPNNNNKSIFLKNRFFFLCSEKEIDLDKKLNQLKQIAILNGINVKDDYANTALHYAIEYNNIEIAKWLLYINPKLIDIKNNLGITPIVLAIDKNDHQNFLRDLIKAHYEILELLKQIDQMQKHHCILT